MNKINYGWTIKFMSSPSGKDEYLSLLTYKGNRWTKKATNKVTWV